MVRKISLGCDAGMEMMEEEFEDCRKTSEPLKKLHVRQTTFLKSISSFL